MLFCLLSDCSPRCRFATLPALTSFVVVVILFATLGHKASIGKREKKGFFFLPLFLGFVCKGCKVTLELRLGEKKRFLVPSK